MKRFSVFAFLLLLTLLAASPVFAQEGAAAAGGASETPLFRSPSSRRTGEAAPFSSPGSRGGGAGLATGVGGAPLASGCGVEGGIAYYWPGSRGS